MRTSEEIYQRVRWDPRFDPTRFVLGVRQRDAQPKRIALPAFVPGGEIPWHRVLFVEADGELVWDRTTGLDRVGVSLAGLATQPRRLREPYFAARTPHAWDATASAWRPAPDLRSEHGAPGTSPRRSAAADKLIRVLTWNTLWDRYDADRIHTARRRPLLLADLRAADADVIALQEVERPLLLLLLAEPWVRNAYTLGTDPTSSDIEDNGLLLLSRLPVTEAARRVLGHHKALTAIAVATPSGALVVAATHLSSDHSTNGAQRREVELRQLSEVLAAVDGNLVLMGDFNDGREGEAGPAAALGLVDAWTAAHGSTDHTPTFDPVVNPLAAVASLTGRASRLDRILIRAARSADGTDVGISVAATNLRGDEPIAEGIFISDHYGVEAQLAFDGPSTATTTTALPGVDVLDVRPTPRTALAWIPPQETWAPLQELRREHDPQIDRWPPHVNVLFGFVPEADFERAAPLLADALASVPAFAARLEGVHTFGHRDDATVWLDPTADDAQPWAQLRCAVEARFPECRGRAEGFTPHLTLGRSTDPQRVAAACAARLRPIATQVGELVLLSRRGEEPMRVRARIALGTGELHWAPDADRDEASITSTTTRGEHEHLAAQTTRLVAAALDDCAVHLVGSRRMGCALPGADLDLIAVLPGDADMIQVRQRLEPALPETTRMREVHGARVPGLKFTVGRDLAVDLVVVPCGKLRPQEAVTRRDELGEAAAVALSAVSDADAVLASVSTAAALTAFTRLAPHVKAWAKARGLDSAPFGGLPGIAWALLAARVAAETVTAEAVAQPSDNELLHRFFATWAAWNWHEPITITPQTWQQPAAAVTVLTPTLPIRNCAEQVTTSGRDLLAQEFYEAWEAMDQAASHHSPTPWAQLTARPPMHRRHAVWAVLDVSADEPARFEALLGRVRGRMRSLIGALEEAGARDVHAWPRPFERTPVSARYAIGLGRTPPDAYTLTSIADQWARGLAGVDVRWTAGGEVSTLS